MGIKVFALTSSPPDTPSRDSGGVSIGGSPFVWGKRGAFITGEVDGEPCGVEPA
ncbi:MAG: hypothetical protein RL588_2223, partial [Pseudomonadota bacterium]